MDKKQVYEFIEENQTVFNDVSDKIWDYAETAFEEFQSMDCICEALAGFGFCIEKGVGDVPTAFTGTWGAGYPVIGFLGEYDALSGMSQEAGTAEEKPLVAGGNGHGCGHNLIGSGALGAAVAFKNYLEENGKKGTVKYFGCPGEEGGSGKAFMARAGVFDGVDIALTWHPGNTNSVMDVNTLANYQVLYKFKGRSSHAAAAPQHGRSALDAVELMNTGVQYLREHVIQEARIHYAITNAGGFSPNVVQANAEVLYLIRAPKMEQVEEIYHRINKIAKGMAMATETEVEIDFIKSCANIIPNKSLNGLLYKNMQEAPSISHSADDLALAAALDSTLKNETNLRASGLTESDAEIYAKKIAGMPIFAEVLPFYPEKEAAVMPGSTDVGDVSWNVPTAQIGAACWTLKSPAHSWQAVAIGRSEAAHKGLIYSAQVLAGTAVDLLEDDSLIKAAKAEFDRRMNGQKYVSPIPAEVKPRAISSL